MKNEILEELWQAKDAVAKEYGYDIDNLVKGLREKEKFEKNRVINLNTKHIRGTKDISKKEVDKLSNKIAEANQNHRAVLAA